MTRFAGRGRYNGTYPRTPGKFIALALLAAGAAVFCSVSCRAAAEPAEPANVVRTVKSADGAWRLEIGGKPYFIKGVVFCPVPVGESPQEATMRDWTTLDDNHNLKNDIAYDTWVDRNGNGRRDPGEEAVGDFELLKRMGCNTIRLYHVASDNPLLGDLYKKDKSTAGQFDHPVNKPLLRALYRDYGIRIIMGNFLGSWTIGSGATWEQGTDYTNPIHRENIKKSVRAMILDNKDEPYVLLWLLGNENNIATWSRCNAKAQPDAYASLVGEIAQMVRELDPNHPVAVCEGDAGNVANLNRYAKVAPALDLVAFNSYRGPYGFNFLWKQAKAAFDRPVFISEFGIFAYNKYRGEDQDQQLKYMQGSWRDIVRQSAGYLDPAKKQVGNCVGAAVFDWADRWYMDGTPFEHNPGTKYWDSPDRLDHEEWFGIVSLGDGSDPLMRQKRKVYDYLADVWNRSELSF